MKEYEDDRTLCEACGGTGIVRMPRLMTGAVSREMAIDAGDRTLEGKEFVIGSCEEAEPCPYCSTKEKRTCRACGCTDENACPGGCTWVETDKDVACLFEKQKGLCPICGRTLEKFCVDHNHITGKIRGLLCHRCNVVIGGLDDPRFRECAMIYLRVNE